MPAELAWTSVMEAVGGYASYLLLLEDERAYEDVVLTLQGRADAERMRRLEEKAREGRRKG